MTAAQGRHVRPPRKPTVPEGETVSGEANLSVGDPGPTAEETGQSNAYPGDHHAGADHEEAHDSEPEPVLPEAVRQRVVTLTSAAMTGMPDSELPPPLRRIARFAPQRRAKLGAAAIATHLTNDPVFRQRIADRVLAEAGELGAAVANGDFPAAADPIELAALAYLARPMGWVELIGKANDAVRAEAEAALIAERVRQAEQRASRAEADRDAMTAELERLRDEVAALRERNNGLSMEIKALTKALRDAEHREQKAAATLASERGRIARTAADHEAEVRRLKAKLADAEAALETARQANREIRAAGDARLWLLLETLERTARGLQAELGFKPVERLPADFVADTAAERPDAAMPGSRKARAADDPSWLDELLGMPRVHLIVDGYNVTKRGFGELSLEQQRRRLVTGLGGIAAQTGIEVTVVFDGAERVHGLPPAPRNVRVLFSRKGETADDLIRRLVRAEPSGRPVVVVSSDREVADGVRRHGAYPVASDALLRRLSRT